jgi:Amt family ammonium transporter
VAGLVAITPCAGYVNAAAAVVIGLVAGVVCFLAISLKYRFRYDDALDVIGVHLVGGIVGSLLVGVFATRAVNANGRDGLLAGGGLQLLGEQALAVGVTMIFSFSVSFVLAKAIDATIGLRVTPDEEIEGLDTTQHAETGYNLRELGSMGRIA